MSVCKDYEIYSQLFKLRSSQETGIANRETKDSMLSESHKNGEQKTYLLGYHRVCQAAVSRTHAIHSELNRAHMRLAFVGAA